MELYRWDPFTALERLDRQFDDIVRRTWGRTGATGAGFVPPIEMAQEGSDVLIKLEVPGIDPSTDVDVSVHEGRLIVTGERRDTRQDVHSGERQQTLVRELRYGSFRREFALPEGVTADDVHASYDKGLLEVRVRNVIKPVEQPRKISIAVHGSETPRQVEGELGTTEEATSS
jgi:HSP20 family protein